MRLGGLGFGGGLPNGVDLGRVVEDEGWAVAGSVDDEGDGEKGVCVYKGHGGRLHGWD